MQPGYLNVFQDPSGNLCAVANLVAFDGDVAMVQATASTTNYVRLADVHEGALHEWILASGFTQEEIARIQEQQQLDRERERLQRTLNRTVARLRRDTDRSLDRAVDRLLRARAVS